MEQSKRVLTERRSLCVSAYERWRGFQPSLATISKAIPNRDGTLPRPRVGAITPEQRSRFSERQRLRSIFDSTAYREVRVAAERRIGATLDFSDLPPNEQALKAGRAVARIVTLPGTGLVPQGFATAFLVAPNLLLTNHHVFRAIDEARGVGAQFLYERTQGGLREGLIFRLDPDRFFLNHKGLDYALVAVEAAALNDAPLTDFRFLPLIGVKGKIRKGDPVSIIQHPEGQPKQYATVNNRLLDLRDDGFLLYETDTLEGSSGAPVFNEHWETIGLHHCGVPRMEDDMLVTKDGRRLPVEAEVADSDLIWIANEGVRVSALVASLADQRMDRPEQQTILAGLLASTRDPLRIVTEQSPLASTDPFRSAPTDGASRTAVAQNVFQITGPVTINLGAAGVAAGTPDALATLAVARPADTDFREKSLKFDENYAGRTKRGYEPGFLQGWSVAAPSVRKADRGPLLLNARKKVWVIPYYHYSLVMNRVRRLLVWAASNVDYSDAARKYTRTRKEYGGENWRLDPRVALEAPGLQIEDVDFYAPARRIDRGHIVRREDSAWGKSAKEAEYGNSDTYHWTNCTPQSEAFNQSGKSGIWGKFEEHIESEVQAIGGRMNVFAGPVLNPDDPERGYGDAATIQVPMEFWKVVACVAEENGKPVRLAYGFVFDQTERIRDLGYERMGMDDYAIYQMPIAEIARKAGVVFDPALHNADVMKAGGAPESIRGFQGKRIRGLEGVVLR